MDLLINIVCGICLVIGLGVLIAIPCSFNGRTVSFDLTNGGSTPSQGAKHENV